MIAEVDINYLKIGFSLFVLTEILIKNLQYVFITQPVGITNVINYIIML